MNNHIMVMVVEGKNESSDFVTIHTFEEMPDAAKFASDINEKSGPSKHWKTASIVDNGERIDIDYDFNPNV